MAITVCGNCIDFGSFSVASDPGGMYVDGVLYHKGLQYPPSPTVGTVSTQAAGGQPRAYKYITTHFFATGTNSTSTTALACCSWGAAGHADDTYGFLSGGYWGVPTYDHTCAITRYPFASCTSDSCVGSLTQARCVVLGHSSPTHGFASGGSGQTTIDKFPFASPYVSTDVGELVRTRGRDCGGGFSSSTDGYAVGTRNPSFVDIEKFSFASGGPAVESTDPTGVPSYEAFATLNSETDGYIAGGRIGGVDDRRIFKFPFASGIGISCVGCLANPTMRFGAGGASETCGFTMGGLNSYIQYFPFASVSTSQSPFSQPLATDQVYQAPIQN